MEKQIIDITDTTFISAEERARLVGLCAKLTGNQDAAEDLAQETLLEAWRSEYRLRDATKRTQWLSGIARNICLRWLRKSGRDAAHLVEPHPAVSRQDAAPVDLEDVLTSDQDVEVELERKELIELLDRALTLLPAETRTVLVQRYIEESPLSTIAAQLGTNTSAVAMRLQRGKLILRRVLTHEMQHDIEDYHQRKLTDMWEETPLWCYLCGQRRLLGIKDPIEGRFHLRCPDCTPEPDEGLSTNHLDAFKGMKGYKPLFTRLATICDRYYRTALRDGAIACSNCGHSIPARILHRKDIPQWVWDRMELRWRWPEGDDDRVVTTLCEHCFTSWMTPLTALSLMLPEARSFLQAHPRIRTLPRQEREVDGRSAILTSFQSVHDQARLDVISDSETYCVLRIYGGKQ
jgi:RNA polymerase sigma-70 factor (ECF subfamily)